MTAIGPGDFVECVVGARSYFEDVHEEVVTGSVYLVDGLEWGFSPSGVWGPGLTLAGFRKDHCWSVKRFRPIYTPRADFIQSLMQPAPAAPETVVA